MQINASNQRIITIKSDNPEWTVRVASILLLGKGKWEVLWTRDSIQVTVDNEQILHLAKVLTTPVTRYGIEMHGDTFYMNKSSLWEIWKQDARFTEMLMTDELIDSIRFDLSKQLTSSNEFVIDEWIYQDLRFASVIQAIRCELEQEGKVAEKLQNFGWV